MQLNPTELANLQRPKLLMATAKYLVEKRKGLGKLKKIADAKTVRKLLEIEAQYEQNRQVNRNSYVAKDHVEVLADLIEYVYLATNGKGIH